MAKNKTVETTASVDKFLDKVEPEQKRDDCFAIMRMMEEVSKEPAKMWGTGIVGCGSYHYVYESGRTGDTCLIGFAPRKSNIVLYLMGAVKNHSDEVEKLGKVKVGGGCIYVTKLEDVNVKVLKSLMKKSLTHVKSGAWLSKSEK